MNSWVGGVRQAGLCFNGSRQVVDGIWQQGKQRGRRKIFPALCGYTETFYVLCCMIAPLPYACSVFLKNGIMSQRKNSWFYTQLSVEGAMLLLNLICIGYMFIKDIFS